MMAMIRKNGETRTTINKNGVVVQLLTKGDLLFVTDLSSEGRETYQISADKMSAVLEAIENRSLTSIAC